MNLPLLAQMATDPSKLPFPVQPRSNFFGLSVRDALMVLAVIGVVALVLFLATYLVRRNRRRSGDGRKVLYHASERELQQRHRGQRRRRRERYGRNPTLQETGGLPPPRWEDEPPKAEESQPPAAPSSQAAPQS
jgi:hypothetical protein